MAEGVTGVVSQCDGRTIYDAITYNRLDVIRALLNPLTIHHRKSVVSQTVRKKTLLGHACELGFQDIVKYLLDECEADISERYRQGYSSLSPLRVAIKNYDVAMIRLLISRGALAADMKEATFCSNLASEKRCPALASLLKNYTGERAPCHIWDHRNVFTQVTNMHLQNTDPFLQASASGDINRMKQLRADGIDTKVTNPTAENALCTAILNETNNAEHFLLNYRVFSLNARVQALELSGAKLIAFQSECGKGLRCWRKALSIRTENFLGTSDKTTHVLHTDLGCEYTCEEQLKALGNNNNNTDIYIQALLVLLRLLTSFSQVVHIAFMVVAQHPALEQDLPTAIKILGKLALLPVIQDNDWGSPFTTAISTMKTLFRGHFLADRANVNDGLTKLRRLLDFIIVVDWQVLLYRREAFYQSAYIHILKRLLLNMILLHDLDIHVLDEDWIKDGISCILTYYPDPYPTTLLHLAAEDYTALAIIPFLISCSDDVNCTDNRKNTPMHKAVLSVDHTHVLRVINLLADAGGHVDASNCFGKTPLNTLISRDIITNPLEYVSLQCLAAQSIHSNNIRVPDVYPKILASFSKLHTS